jgi:hypothetical protein
MSVFFFCSVYCVTHSRAPWLNWVQKKSCIGEIDGNHIRLITPSGSRSLYYNYKHYLSIDLLAVCDADYKLIYIDVGAYQKCNDSGETLYIK